MASEMDANEKQFDLIIKLDDGEQLLAHRHVMAIVSPEIKKLLEGERNPNGSFVKKSSEGKFSVHFHMNRYKMTHFMKKKA